MEHWFDKAMSNSMNIVAAKKDELKSELELRYHLHQPRAQRIEMDIHNVRAGKIATHTQKYMVVWVIIAIDKNVKHKKKTKM